MRLSFIPLVLFASVCLCRADDPAPTTQPVDNKWQFNLFNPTPSNELREMDTDRPDKTNTPHTIDAGHLQIETGFFDYNYYRDKYQGANARMEALDLGQFNFRLGVLNDLELNAVVDSVDIARNTDYVANQSARQNGFGDLTLGGKMNFWGNDDSDDVWDTVFGIQPQFKIPTARQMIGNGHAEADVGLPMIVNLPAGFTLSLETDVSWLRNLADNGDVTGWANMASLDRPIFGKWDVYLEYWSQVTTEKHQEAEQTLDTGFTYPATDNVTFDTGVNFGLNHASDSIEWTAGVSVRF
jgi:hypothetical protein